MRLRADASTASVRTVERSKKRLAELQKVSVESLTEDQRVLHAAKLDKHARAVERCESEGRTSCSVTDPHAALMKFPSGASLPGHRITALASGSGLRLVVSALVDAAPTDYGKLTEAVTSVEQALQCAGVVIEAGKSQIQVAADAGYLGETDLRFAADNRARIDILIPIPPQRTPVIAKGGAERQLGKDQFRVEADGTAICPAGRTMEGPHDLSTGVRTWRGVGCGSCELRARCTTAERRTLSENTRTKALRDAMAQRMSEPDARARYGRRIATIEPVFGTIEDTMAFTRACSRRTETVKAEVMLKLLTYNLMRLHLAASTDAPHRPVYIRGFQNSGDVAEASDIGRGLRRG